MSQDDIPPNLLKSRLLAFRDDGSIALKKWRLVSLLVIGVIVPAACLTAIHYITDTWAGPALIISGAIAAIAWYAMDARRQLLIARDPGRARRLSLAELMLLVTIAVVLAGGFALNQQQRSQEMARRAELKGQAEALLGPGSDFSRDHRGKIRINISDTTFDDARLEQLALALAKEPDRYGVSHLAFQTPPNTRAGLDGVSFRKVTDRSAPFILRWSQLRKLSLGGTAITEQGATQLTDLPKLRWLDWTSNFSRENAAEIKRKHPDLWIGVPGDFP